MKKCIFITAGGAAGAILRYLIKEFNNVPLYTLLINITGCFLLSFILTLSAEKLHISTELRLSLTTGFLGAFTTFSALCKDASAFFMNHNILNGSLYLLFSIMLGLAAVYFGSLLAELILINPDKGEK